MDAKDDKAVSFYKKYGFLELPKVAKRPFLPMGTVEKLFDSSTADMTCPLSPLRSPFTR